MNQVQTNAKKIRRAWRTIDFVTVAILAAALGVAFWGYDVFVYPLVSTAVAFYPPIGELQLGVWMVPAVLGMLLVRKPGAALLAELIAANVEILLGNSWGVTVFISGVAQALGIELIFAFTRYQKFSVKWAAIGAAISAGFEVLYEFYAWVPDFSLPNKLVYLVCGLISGAVIAGFGGFGLVKALAATGTLNAFAVGRESK